MGKGASNLVDRVRGKTAGDVPFDLASEATLELCRQLLEQIELNTDGLEFSTTGLAQETTLQQVRDYLDTVETKLQELLDRVGDDVASPAANTLQARLQAILVEVAAINLDFDIALSTRASEATLLALKTRADLLATEATLALLRGDVQAFQAAFDARDLATETTLATRATEATLASVLAAVDGVEALLTAIRDNTDSLEVNTDDLEAKVDAVKASVDAFKAAFDARDLATETTLAAFKAEQKAEADETQAAIAAHQASNEAGLAAANASLDAIESDADAIRIAAESLAAEDFATETTLDNLRDNVGLPTDPEAAADGTLIAIVKRIRTRLDSLSAEDFATEATLAAFRADNHADLLAILAAVDGLEALVGTTNTTLSDIDDSVGDTTDAEAAGDGTVIAILKRLRTRLDDFITAFSAEDFATEATLSAFRTENDANLDAVNAELDAHTTALAAANASLDAIEADIDALNTKFDVNLSTRASEATLALRNNASATLMNAQFAVGQEIRMDDIVAGDLYIGRNTDSALTSAATWEVVRIYRTATGLTTRIRYRSGVVWDNRTAGW